MILRQRKHLANTGMIGAAVALLLGSRARLEFYPAAGPRMVSGR